MGISLGRESSCSQAQDDLERFCVSLLVGAYHRTCKSVPSHFDSFPQPSSCLTPPLLHGPSPKALTPGSALGQALNKAIASLLFSCWFPKSSSTADTLTLLSSQQEITHWYKTFNLGSCSPTTQVGRGGWLQDQSLPSVGGLRRGETTP